LEKKGGQTYVKVQLTFSEFEVDDGEGGESDVGRGNFFPEVAQVFVKLPHFFWTPSPPKIVLGLFFPLVHQVQGESIKKGRIPIVVAHADKLALLVFVGVPIRSSGVMTWTRERWVVRKAT